MTPNEARIEELAQQIYIARNNERNDVTGSERTAWLDTTISWVNQFVPELEKEAYWNWSRQNDFTLGTAGTSVLNTFELDNDIRALVVDLNRPVYLVKEGAVVSTFDTVSPSLLRNRGEAQMENRVAQIGRSVVFSRPFTEQEIGSTIYCDIVNYLPKLSMTNTKLLTTVDPAQLLILGVLKNQILPDIVQGRLSPSYAQKYADLLEGVKALNDMSSEPGSAGFDDLSFIGAV